MVAEFDFWRDHSDTFLTMANLWQRRKKMADPDCSGTKTGDCGDTVTLYLSIADGMVKAVNFELDGCMHTNACCNAVAELTEGKSLESCWELSPSDIINYLQTLPRDHYHCAELSVGTLYLALADYGAAEKVENAG
jgi:nitrogen fixation NifU-like protein